MALGGGANSGGMLGAYMSSLCLIGVTKFGMSAHLGKEKVYAWLAALPHRESRRSPLCCTGSLLTFTTQHKFLEVVRSYTISREPAKWGHKIQGVGKVCDF